MPACPLPFNLPVAPQRFQNSQVIQRNLVQSRTIAIVGLSTNPEKDSHSVAKYLAAKGYVIIPVHPKAKDIMGRKAYRTLPEIVEPVDLVSVFRPAHETPLYAKQAVEIGAKAFWTQLQIVNEEAAKIAEDAGLEVVMDRCIKIEHIKYMSTFD